MDKDIVTLKLVTAFMTLIMIAESDKLIAEAEEGMQTALDVLTSFGMLSLEQRLGAERQVAHAVRQRLEMLEKAKVDSFSVAAAAINKARASA